ncbi:hypothetical protein NDU88_003909 [Pleurodeles waltl]|uniref:Uncharacterized protein n=1 Tax=Pleurodeles waltl TaxID=8319 RepID=A0AAV7NKS6_PLEWA|nr:hypothetical protein NDU88_003909 [Pleurodeles waltl]
MVQRLDAPNRVTADAERGALVDTPSPRRQRGCSGGPGRALLCRVVLARWCRHRAAWMGAPPPPVPYFEPHCSPWGSTKLRQLMGLRN